MFFTQSITEYHGESIPIYTTIIHSHGEYFVIHTEYHGISRGILDRDYNFYYFSVAISEKRKSVILRDHPCEKKKRHTVRKEKNRDSP